MTQKTDNTLPIYIAEQIRTACIEAAREGFREAAISGLCSEGAEEAAISAIQKLDLETVLKKSSNNS